MTVDRQDVDLAEDLNIGVYRARRAAEDRRALRETERRLSRAGAVRKRRQPGNSRPPLDPMPLLLFAAIAFAAIAALLAIIGALDILRLIASGLTGKGS